ncbi:TOMM precursor leader peptide-binding protein [Streptomyces polygonati]|uniref:TOMM leader peptide-binding protein n=1 Tax=Streptomyces polygonati TaxID=1617087 RepID=A0ABV8HG40_9ACTN
MTSDTAELLAPAAGSSPMEAAGRELELRLARRTAGRGDPAAPLVAMLGAHDVLRPEPPERAGRRAVATVHLTPESVLIGPWGGAADPADPAYACGSCLAVRWQRLRTRTEREALETGADLTAAGGWPVLPDYAADAVAALHSWAFTRPEPWPDGLARVTRYDLETGRVRTVPLLAEPLCGAPCHQRPREEEPFALESRPKEAADRYRLRAPSGYPLPTGALANPVCGVLGAATWNDVTSPTTAPVAGTVFMRGYAGLTDVTWSGQANSFSSSRDLAFLEGLERYAGTHRRTPGGGLTESYDNLGDAALDPRACGLYAPSTYRDDPMLAPFDPARPIPWVRGHSLRDDRPVWVPARLVHYSAGTDADPFVFECSNGCATGSCLEEAILFGLLELVERDAFLLGWYGDAPLPEIDLASCGSPTIRAMTDRAALCGYDVHVYDNRIDLPVPVVTGLAVRRDDGPGTLAFAAGAAFEPEAAVESAVSEILTYLPHLPRQVAERPAELAAMAEDFSLVKRLPDHAALFGLPRMKRYVRGYLEPPAVRSLADTYRSWEGARPRSGDLRDDVRWLRDRLAGAGSDVIVVDQTAPEQRRMGLRTVCTIVPGLLPIDFGWARQRALTMPRLRTAQRRGGLRDHDLREDQLRLVPHPFP